MVKSNSALKMCFICLVQFGCLKSGRAAVNLADISEPVAIQKRQYKIDQSMLVSVGYLPSDSFNKGYSFSGAFRFALAPYLNWEVVSFAQVAHQDTGLKQRLSNLNIDVTNVGLGGRIDYVKQIVMTELLYSPLYTKSLALKTHLVYGESSLSLGVGTVNFNAAGLQPMLAPGIVTRFFISDNKALNIYLRDYFYRDDATGVSNIIDFGIGLEFGFHLIAGNEISI